MPRLDEHRRIVLIKVAQAHAPEGAALVFAAEDEDTAALVLHEHLGGRQQRILVGEQAGPRTQELVELAQHGRQGAAERRLGARQFRRWRAVVLGQRLVPKQWREAAHECPRPAPGR